MTSATASGGAGGRRPARIVCVALSPSIDVTYVVPHLAPGTIHRPAEVYRVPGGKGFNVARAARALGADVAAAGVLGGDSGAWMVAMLARSGMRLATVMGIEPTRTCVSVSDRSAGTLTEFYEPPPRITPKAWSDLLHTVVRVCDEHPSWVSLSGSLPPGPVPEALADLVAAAKGAGAKVAVDTHSTALAAAVGAGADLLKVNVEEAAALLGSGRGTGYGDGGDDATGADPLTAAQLRDPAVLATALLAASPHTSLAIVTAGADGAVVASRTGPPLRATLDVRGDFPVGSGDSFLGGLLTALADAPDDVETALRLAMGAGAANALTPGAGVLDAGTARTLAEKVLVTTLSPL
ncbi:1-phosphofructokinase family hexose kinase [Kineosporia sp. R_H_3]|uniref:1-phosphofructokinase family hexose kinase n=1 Tax=Kineosporia sp. R_H_3 TaxID=1961848 RepID=UPI000B4BAFA2|nr:PfkB family carbohydrate kinase [Kineosporia sp. R_H_3]